MNKLQINPNRFIYTSVDEIEPVLTSHNTGSKKVLCKGFPESVQLKQIALGGLSPGESVAVHTHLDMDEYYHVLTGNGVIYIDEVLYKLEPGIFINVPAGAAHRLECGEIPLEFFYFGLEILL